MLHKDLALDRLAELGNVAQFVAFRPEGDGLRQSTARVAGMSVNEQFVSVAQAVSTLLDRSAEGAVNVRSYLPEDPRSREFVYGIRTAEEAIAHLSRLAAAGLHLIVNETIDIHDGGVSGVAQGEIIEFAPDDTPRAVEKPDIASMPRAMGLQILSRVYGFAAELPNDSCARVEFSIHPARRGWRQTHTLLWEIEAVTQPRQAPAPTWPNRFSRHLGDKCFGLLVAEQLGAAVPRTLAIPRRIAPFYYGEVTGSCETWIRTCPREPQPGRFTTAKGWQDPFELLAAEDIGREIASVLSQNAIPALWSGAAIVDAAGRLVIEGVPGEGDHFMLGFQAAKELPVEIVRDVAVLQRNLAASLGPVRMEWVHDGARAWVVQLHVGATTSISSAIVDGEADEWHVFEVERGLVELRRFLDAVPDGVGLIIRGDVGLTSHIADVVRKWARPARIERA